MVEMLKQEEMETVRELIKDIDTAMLTTVTEEGLVSRPMKTQEVEFDGDLWFFTKKETDKYEEILHEQDVNVAYAGKSYVSIRGSAEIVSDLEKKKELWSKAYEKIMQTSYDSPDVVLIKIQAEAAEYWDTGNFTKKIAFMYKRMTGQSAKSTDINETVELKK
ncbi:general stress protein [Terribacillus saccharophilus]|uniref:General stress protein n=2 Tax=Terribacillus saccharophilus TaxID=361277 RepID=A0A268HDA2_9BACI|nr:pyridoxamine 5'-phosphate oxidase family protein [Terribacillus saccharophilus]MEC0304486.1 pyridoxamine 5'-phosphate oxidase family protein [Terribacillus saccharophilus]PAD36638.1 general stress protein [Terribacillus saccharophilus]PAD97620.1 general stress protein [Terribacillus saccharophilus]PAE01667.1 general stress protein [Terribacillus saccharophilus]PAE07834.1 general stress protein [Terribacillus saccharophilus]